MFPRGPGGGDRKNVSPSEMFPRGPGGLAAPSEMFPREPDGKCFPVGREKRLSGMFRRGPDGTRMFPRRPGRRFPPPATGNVSPGPRRGPPGKHLAFVDSACHHTRPKHFSSPGRRGYICPKREMFPRVPDSSERHARAPLHPPPTENVPPGDRGVAASGRRGNIQEPGKPVPDGETFWVRRKSGQRETFSDCTRFPSQGRGNIVHKCFPVGLRPTGKHFVRTTGNVSPTDCMGAK